MVVEAQNFEGYRDKKFRFKTRRFWPICLLPMENVAIFLDFSFLLFIFLPYFLPPWNFTGDVPLTENFRPASTACEYGRFSIAWSCHFMGVMGRLFVFDILSANLAYQISNKYHNTWINI